MNFKSLIFTGLVILTMIFQKLEAQVNPLDRNRQNISDLQLTKTVDKSVAKVGSIVNFTLKVKNLGPNPTEGATVFDLLPNGFTFINSSNPFAYNNVTGEWDVNDLIVGAEETLTITALVNPITTISIYTNVAQIMDNKSIDNNNINDKAECVVIPFDFGGGGNGSAIGTGGSICSNSSALLRSVSTNVIDPIFKWYADAQLANLVHIGANFTTPELLTTTTYYLVVTGANIPAPVPSDAKQITVEVLAKPSTPDLTVVQPTCDVSTGSIRVSSPVGNGFTYSIDGSTYLNTTGVFNGVTAGTYNVSVKNAVGCISSVRVAVVESQPVLPAAPSLNIIQPTCELSTGTISVSSPINVGNSYSINSVDYSNTTGVFTGVVPGTYNVSVKNAVGCISSATVAVVNPHPLTPVVPTVEVISPTCPEKTGSIRVSSPIGSGFTYSIDGSTYLNTTGVFTSVVPGAYNVSVKNASGCVSTGVVAIIKNPVVNESKLVITASGSANICEGGSVILTSSDASSYQWYKYGVAISGANGKTFTASTEGVYTVSRFNNNECVAVQSDGIEVKVLAKPSTPDLTVVQPTCDVSTGSIRVSSPVGNGFTYSIDGSTYLNTTGVFNGVTAGTYNVSVKNAVGCISSVRVAVVESQPVLPAAPSLNIIQPTCELSTGTISVSSPINVGNSYSINSVDYSNTTGVFTGVVPGTYNVSVKNAVGCISSATVAVVNPHPLTPVVPTVEVISPTCPEKTGSIRVSSPIGSGFTYSIDGSTYLNTTGVFTSVVPGAYNVSVKNASGCVSTGVVAIIKNPVVNESKLVITASGSANICEGGSVILTSSDASSYQWYKYGVAISGANGKTFTASTEGVYTVSRFNNNECVAVQSDGIEVKVLAKPSTPDLTVVQPTCDVSTGSIRVSSPVGNGFTYSIDGSTYLNTTGVFNGVTAGTYNVSVKNAVGCISSVRVAVVESQPVLPAAPSLNIIQPTCELSTGTISVSSPINVGNSYSINSVDYSNTTGVFTGVVPGTYNVSVKNAVGCISSATVAVVNPHPLTPVVPTVEVISPTCPEKTGSIRVSSPIGSGFTYSIDGSTYLNTTGVFTSVVPGAYNVSVKNASGCVSTGVVAIIKNPVVNESKLVITASGSANICEGGSVILTSSDASSYQWYKYGVAISGANGKTFTASTEGVYTVSRFNNNECVAVQSDGIEVKVVANPIAPLVTADKLLFCFGDSVVLNATSSVNVQWYKDGILIPATTKRYVAKQGGTYAAIAVNNNGCRSSFSEAVVLNMVDLPVTPVLTISGTAKFCKDESRLLKVIIPNGLTVNWYKNGTLINNYSKDTLRVNEAAEFTVKFMNTSGCLSLVSNKIITEIGCNNTNIYVPDVFTPNGDDINDVVKAVCVGIAKFKFFKIYNRWGNILFETSDESKGWDGKFRGQVQPADSYIWLVEGVDTNGKEIRKTGTLNLIK